jgi:CRP-like cAMP-binding protein
MILSEELESIGFLRDLGESYLGQIALMAWPKEYDEGDILFHEGDTSPVLYFILRGEVSLETERRDGGPVSIYTAGPGEMVGWSPVLGRGVMTATARASSRCRVAVLDAKRILALCEKDPHFGVAFLKQVGVFLSERLNSTRRCLAAAHEGSD